ncbi:MAG TPA: PfkB family carbohydrate kinase [bacterium]|nr:PfkB family carbohydrate kinase [bacterium]
MSLLIVGTVAFDSVETPFGKTERVLGGSGTFAGYAASFFERPRLVGVVGSDFPDTYLSILEERGIDVSGVERKEGKTFFWAGRYETDVNIRTTLITELNVLQEFDPVLPENFRDSSFLFLANIDPALQLKVLDQCRNLEFVIADTMNFWIDASREALDEVISRIGAILVNDEEARMLTGETVLQKAAKKILEMGPKIVIIKKGEHGVMMFTRDSFFAFPGYPIDEVKDPTGAGDSFAGGFIGYLASKGTVNDETLKQAIVAGSTTASFCCEDFSIDKFRNITSGELLARAGNFREATSFQPLDF